MQLGPWPEREFWRNSMPRKVKIAWFGLHRGEEPPLVSGTGAGGIFFSGCHLSCVFCQNWQISQGDIGLDYTVEELAKIMLELQASGASNIDLVTPTIWWQDIVVAVKAAKEQGLSIPIVWNSNGYENIELLKNLEGVVDIYLPDWKYSDDTLAEKYSAVSKYNEITRKAIAEMYRQVGTLQVVDGVAKKGLIVRHLVLPGMVNNSIRVLKQIAEIDKDIHIALMNQYAPTHLAARYPEINRTVTDKEFGVICDAAVQLGFTNGWIQDSDSQTIYFPNFTKQNPFSDI